MRRLLTALSLGASLFALASPARANGRFPAANQVEIAPSDPSTLLLRTTFGLLLTRDHGAHWDWICERAVGYGAQQEDPAVTLTADGSILAGTREGLALSPGANGQSGPPLGCGWSFAGDPLAHQGIADLVVRSAAPHAALVLATARAASTDAGLPTYRSQIFATPDDGASWSAVSAPLDPSITFETIEVAASDPSRVYLSGWRSSTSGAGVLLVSTDGGASFQEIAVALDATKGELAPFLAAVDPTDADRVYLRTNGTSTSRLLVSADAGKSFDVRYSGGTMLGFALSADGAKVYLGGASDGLRVAARSDYLFTQASSIEVQCLRTHGSALLVCSNERSGFALGESTDDGKTIAPLLHLANLRGPLACPADAATSVCAADWGALARQLGIDAVADDAGSAAPIDAAASEASDASDAIAPVAAAPSARDGGCGCRPAGGDARGTAAAPLVAILLAVAVCARRFFASKR